MEVLANKVAEEIANVNFITTPEKIEVQVPLPRPVNQLQQVPSNLDPTETELFYFSMNVKYGSIFAGYNIHRGRTLPASRCGYRLLNYVPINSTVKLIVADINSLRNESAKIDFSFKYGNLTDTLEYSAGSGKLMSTLNGREISKHTRPYSIEIKLNEKQRYYSIESVMGVYVSTQIPDEIEIQGVLDTKDQAVDCGLLFDKSLPDYPTLAQLAKYKLHPNCTD